MLTAGKRLAVFSIREGKGGSIWVRAGSAFVNHRDDTGSPKDCELGGVRRARISSQCYKRAIRDAFSQHELLDEAEQATRTKRLVEAVAERVIAAKKNVINSASLIFTAIIT